MGSVDELELLITNLERAIILARSSDDLLSVAAKVEQALDAARRALADKLNKCPNLSN